MLACAATSHDSRCLPRTYLRWIDTAATTQHNLLQRTHAPAPRAHAPPPRATPAPSSLCYTTLHIRALGAATGMWPPAAVLFSGTCSAFSSMPCPAALSSSLKWGHRGDLASLRRRFLTFWHLDLCCNLRLVAGHSASLGRRAHRSTSHCLPHAAPYPHTGLLTSRTLRRWRPAWDRRCTAYVSCAWHSSWGEDEPQLSWVENCSSRATNNAPSCILPSGTTYRRARAARPHLSHALHAARGRCATLPCAAACVARFWLQTFLHIPALPYGAAASACTASPIACLTPPLAP